MAVEEYVYTFSLSVEKRGGDRRREGTWIFTVIADMDEK